MGTIGIIGAGAAGLMAAHFAAGEPSASVVLFEKNSICAKKILITGKGRCNVTTTTPVGEMEPMIPRGGKFLRTALYSFSPSDLRALLEQEGVPLKEERGGRVFPVSDRAGDVASALTCLALSHQNVTLRKEAVKDITKTDSGFLITASSGKETFERILIATGGVSYPRTGSDGDGYRFARALGHTVTPLTPSLIPLVTKESFPKECMGLSLKNTALRVETVSGKKVYEDFGEMLFCHFGVSGPMILSASAHLDFQKEKEYRLFLDLKPALSEEELDKRLLSDFGENQNKDLVNSLSRLLPQKLIRPILKKAGLSERKKVHLVTKEERWCLLRLLKKLPLTLTGCRPIEEAIVTRGGVALSEVNPRTMESKLVKGLYFAGEILDADGLTGGYNLQIAFSTGHLAGKSISQEV